MTSTIEVGNSWELANQLEAAVVGAGPKGMAMQIAFGRSKVDAILLDSSPSIAQNWSASRMEPTLLVTPSNLEITSYSDLQFSAFLKKKYADLEVLPRPTAADLYEYLQYLKTKIQNLRMGIQIDGIEFHEGKVYLRCKGGRNIIAHQAVLATGLIGFGEKEFAFYPPGISESENVRHYPSSLVGNQEVIEYIGSAQKIAIVGGNLAGLNALEICSELKGLTSIHVIAQDPILAGGHGIQNLKADGDRKHLIREAVHQFRQNSQRNHYHQATIQSIQDRDGQVTLRWPEGALNVEKVILATGFQYDFKALPFLKDGLLRQFDIRMASDGRRPQLDAFQRLITPEGSLPIFAIGEAAAGTFGEACRRLPSTREEISRILAGMRARI